MKPTINPYRYRGYRFDIETGLYYLQSRYYDPEIGRFISMDDTKILMLTQGELLGANLFAYCGNNPVMYVDPWGYFGFWVNVSTDLVSWILDVAISFAGFAIAAKGVFDMIKLIKSGRVYIRTSMEKALKKACLGALTGFLNTVFTVLDRFTKFSSIGGIIANTIDWLDGKYDGRIKFYVKLW